MENLALLFRKARAKAEGVKDAEPPRADGYSEFVKEFIVLHSFVFGKDVRYGSSYISVFWKCRLLKSFLFSLERFSSAKSAFLGKFMDLLKTQQFHPELLIRLFIVNFGAAHLIQNAVQNAETVQSYGDDSPEEGQSPASVVQRIDDTSRDHPSSGNKRRMTPQKANVRTKTSARVLANRHASVQKFKEDLTLEQKKEIGKQLVLLSIDMACPVFTAVTELAQRVRIDGVDEGNAVARMLPVVKLIGRWLLARARDGQDEVLKGEHGLWTVFGMMVTVVAASAGVQLGNDGTVAMDGLTILKEDLDFAGFAPVLEAGVDQQMFGDEAEHGIEDGWGGEKQAMVRAKFLVGLGVELSKCEVWLS